MPSIWNNFQYIPSFWENFQYIPSFWNNFQYIPSFWNNFQYIPSSLNHVSSFLNNFHYTSVDPKYVLSSSITIYVRAAHGGKVYRSVVKFKVGGWRGWVARTCYLFSMQDGVSPYIIQSLLHRGLSQYITTDMSSRLSLPRQKPLTTKGRNLWKQKHNPLTTKRHTEAGLGYIPHCVEVYPTDNQSQADL